jgi:hypothetical protein
MEEKVHGRNLKQGTRLLLRGCREYRKYRESCDAAWAGAAESGLPEDTKKAAHLMVSGYGTQTSPPEGHGAYPRSQNSGS